MKEPYNLDDKVLLSIFMPINPGQATLSTLYFANRALIQQASLPDYVTRVAQNQLPRPSVNQITYSRGGRTHYLFDIGATVDTTQTSLELVTFNNTNKSEDKLPLAVCLRYKDPFVEQHKDNPQTLLAAANLFDIYKQLLIHTKADPKFTIKRWQNNRVQDPKTRPADYTEAFILQTVRRNYLGDRNLLSM